MSPETKRGNLLLIALNGKVESGGKSAVVNNKGDKEVRRVTIRHDQMILSLQNPAYLVIA